MKLEMLRTNEKKNVRVLEKIEGTQLQMTAEFPVMGMSEDFLFYKKETTVGGEGRIWAIDLHKLDDPNLKGEPFFVSEE